MLATPGGGEHREETTRISITRREHRALSEASMNAPTPDEREDGPLDSPPAFDLQHRLDDAVNPRRITFFPESVNDPTSEWITADADVVIPLNETI